MSTQKTPRRMGDRSDGRLIRSLSGFDKFIPFIMPTRNDACNMYSDAVEITEADRWLRSQRVQGCKGIGFLHVMIAAYIRCIAMYPGVNRFIAGRHIFARDDVQIVMAVKRSLDLNAPETTIKVHFDPADTIYDVYNKMNEKIEEVRSQTDNATDRFADIAGRVPRFLLRFIIWLLRGLDFMGWLPNSILEISPFHGSMIITDMGSLGIKPIYHHIYNFGTLPVFIAFGAKRKAYDFNINGKLEEHKYLDIKGVLDERTIDGLYYATVLRSLKHFVAHPELLAVPPEKVVEDIP